MMKYLAAIFTAAALLACSAEQLGGNRVDAASSFYEKEGCTKPVVHPLRITIERLISNPSLYEGRAVLVEGFYLSYFEHSALYPNPQNKESVDTKKGLWILGEVPRGDSGKRVKLVGIFTAGIKGHLSQWPATICAARVSSQ